MNFNIWQVSSQSKSTLVVDEWSHSGGVFWLDIPSMVITAFILLFPIFQKWHRELWKTDDIILVF